MRQAALVMPVQTRLRGAGTASAPQALLALPGAFVCVPSTPATLQPCLQGGASVQAKKQRWTHMILVGLKPPIPGSVGRCLIHGS